jgi:hypothetical protein
MVDIPLARGDYKRNVAAAPYLALRNRFAEANPALNDTPVSVISRPALRKFMEVGTGHIRATYTELGVFDDALFVVSGVFLHRVSPAGVQSLIGQLGAGTVGAVSFASVAPIGDIPAHLFIADGGILWVYNENGQSSGHLQASGAIANGDVVRIGAVYYQWTNASVDAGAPAGTVGNPWLVALGGSNGDALTALYHAINDSGAPGVDYSTALDANPSAFGYNVAANDLYVSAFDYGIAGDAIVTTTTGANLAWGAATLEDGGEDQLRQVAMPDDYGAISLATINRYVIVVPVQHEEISGRFYWIEPGEITVDALNFATAERSPDPVHQVKVFGDMFWLLGGKTTEPWITTGNPDAPMQRFTGILFDRGSWEGTAVQVKDSLILCDEDGGVFQIQGGQARISRPDIEERIRLAMQRQKMLEF